MVAKNHCLMKLREKNGKAPVSLTEKAELLQDTGTDTQELLQNDLTLNLMEESLQELNEEQKQCVTLFYLEKKSYQEVADISGYNLLQVKSYIQNGKRNLKILIEKKLKEQTHKP